MDKIEENASREEIIKSVNDLIEIRNREVEAKIKEFEAKIDLLEREKKFNALFYAQYKPPKYP